MGEVVAYSTRWTTVISIYSIFNYRFHLFHYRVHLHNCHILRVFIKRLFIPIIKIDSDQWTFVSMIHLSVWSLLYRGYSLSYSMVNQSLSSSLLLSLSQCFPNSVFKLQNCYLIITINRVITPFQPSLLLIRPLLSLLPFWLCYSLIFVNFVWNVIEWVNFRLISQWISSVLVFIDSPLSFSENSMFISYSRSSFNEINQLHFQPFSLLSSCSFLGANIAKSSRFVFFFFR